jgi:hypothetical protein
LWRILRGEGPWLSDDEERQAGALNNYLVEFIEGGEITVSTDPAERECLLKRLRPPPPETWEMRVSEPLPGIRVFGRFACRNTFVDFHEQGTAGGRVFHEHAPLPGGEFFTRMPPSGGEVFHEDAPLV